MEDIYNFKEVEPKVRRLWEEGMYFAPGKNSAQRPYSMFFMPPNASGPMHVGNALMIAIQDVLARYHRAKGESTLWVPGTDHGGYETQVTYEREMGKQYEEINARSRKELFGVIEKFVEHNNEVITGQIKAMGASVDWSRFRFTLDEPSLLFVHEMFKKMVSDNLVYRSSYMVNYCSSCATVLTDIELKDAPVSLPRYFVKFPHKNEDGHLSIATLHPEFLFAVTHVLVHPQDARFAQYIGRVLSNPITGHDVHVVESKRKFDATQAEPLSVFSPSHKSYDFEYALRHGLPARNLFDWGGAMVEGYPGARPEEARAKVLEQLSASGSIESVDTSSDVEFLCKKGHVVQKVIRMTWFLNLDDEKISLRTGALDALQKEKPIIHPRWREKGLVDWIRKMHNWPIARQNVWGIKIPLWYEVSDPGLFTVWFLTKEGSRRHGNLQTFLDAGISFDEIAEGLERIYAAEGVAWTLQKEEGKQYLPETDVFDTWFSSCVWGVLIFGDVASAKDSDFYPSDVIVLGHDLIRLFIARKILLGCYLTKKLPFKRVYFHQLLKSADGQKMSKSAGNVVPLDHYLETYGADVTRMALVSYTGLQEDFVFANERLEFFTAFSGRLWKMGRVCNAANTYSIGKYTPHLLSAEDTALLSELADMRRASSVAIEKYFLAQAQEKLVLFLERLEHYAEAMLLRDDAEQALAVFYHAFREYITALHPCMPFMTEELNSALYRPTEPLAAMRRAR